MTSGNGYHQSGTEGGEGGEGGHSEKTERSQGSSPGARSRGSETATGGDSQPGSRGSESATGGDSQPGAHLDVDAAIAPYPNGAEPFGQEEPARALTKASVKESEGMVDQIESAQGVEAKRAVNRALTKLRGATIATYDGIAKGHLGNVDSYNTNQKWRDTHHVRHLAEEEGDVKVWAFPKKGAPMPPSGLVKPIANMTA